MMGASDMTTCPACGHDDDDHTRESWYDEEGIEGMSCDECYCRWWTWDWQEVLTDEAMHEGTDIREAD